MSNLWKALRDVSRDSDHSAGFEPALGSETPAPHLPPSASNPAGSPAVRPDSQLEPRSSRQAIPGQPAPRPRTTAPARPAPATEPGPADGKHRLAPLESPLRRRVGGTGVPLDKPRSPLANGTGSGTSPKPRPVTGNGTGARNGTGAAAGSGTGTGGPRIPGPAAEPGTPRIPRPAARSSLLDTIRERAAVDPAPLDPQTPDTVTGAPSAAAAAAPSPAVGAPSAPDVPAGWFPAPVAAMAPRPPAGPSGNGHGAGGVAATTGSVGSPLAIAPLRSANGGSSNRSYGSVVAPDTQLGPQWKPGDDDVIPNGGRKVARPRLKDRLPW